MTEFQVLGLHHVTATVDAAQADLDFYVGLLGLRLVKKTVNFDNHHVYHFYYGDERGTPGTIWTTFPYSGRGVPVGRKGHGQIIATAVFGSSRLARCLAGPPGTQRHCTDDVAGVIRTAAGVESIAVVDPSGLESSSWSRPTTTRTPWPAGGVDAASAIRGLHSVTMTIAAPAPTHRLDDQPARLSR